MQKMPFEIIYGRPPPPLVSYEPGTTMVGEVVTLLKKRDIKLKALKAVVHQTQQQMKSLADSKRREVEFTISDWVYIKLKLYRQSALFIHKHPKLAPHFIRPFQIIEGVGPVAYKLELPSNINIHLVFHVSQLCKASRSVLLRIMPPPPFQSDATVCPQSAAVLSV